MAYIKSQQERIDRGLCKDCGQSREGSTSSIKCKTCQQQSSSRASERKKRLREGWKSENSGKCHSCGRSSNSYCCLVCRESSKKYKPKTKRIRKPKDRAGICSHCSKPAMKKRCKSCWTKDLLRKHGIDTNLWEVFWRKLEEQSFKCFYTGIKIIPEENASLDHVIPKVKGGTNDLDNLVWCDRKINSFKNDNDYESLIKICQLILEQHEVRNNL